MKATFEQAREWTDRRLIDINGEKIGTVNDMYNDDVTGEPEWLQVKSGFFGSHTSLVPVAQVRRSGDDLMVSFTKDRVREAPQVANSQGLSSTEQRVLYEYYGLALATPPPAGSNIAGAAGASRSEHDFGDSGLRSGAQDGPDAAQNLGGKAADLGGDASRKAADFGGDAADKSGDVAGGVKDVGEDIGSFFRDEAKDVRDADDWGDNADRDRDWDFPGSASEAKDQLRERVEDDKGKRPPEPRV